MEHIANLSVILSTPAGFAFLVAVAATLLLIHLTRHLGALFFLAAFPATLAHELTHLSFGLITRGRPSRIRLWPQRTPTGYALGTVTFSNVRWYNGLIIGLAPLVLLPLAVVLLVWRVGNPDFGWAQIGWVYIVACLTYGSLPSWQDVRVALGSSWLVLLLALGIAAWRFGWIAVVR